ncbi:MAG: TSUP family transporter [Clostridia bacterium]|nr:TSUP family transporter [Clostridia bacterium]
MKIILKYLAVGAISGFVSGFFGAGGGVVLIFALSLLIKNGQKRIFAQTALITASFALVSAVIYQLKGNLPFESALHYVLPAALGGALGAFLLAKLKLKLVKRVFALTVILGGLIMIFR